MLLQKKKYHDLKKRKSSVNSVTMALLMSNGELLFLETGIQKVRWHLPSVFTSKEWYKRKSACVPGCSFLSWGWKILPGWVWKWVMLWAVRPVNISNPLRQESSQVHWNLPPDPGSTTTAIGETATKGTQETSTTTLPQALILQGANTYFRLLSAKFCLSPYWEAAFWNSSSATEASTFCSIRNFGTGLFGYKPDTGFILEKIQNANNCDTMLTLGKQLHLELWQVPVSVSVVLRQSRHHRLPATLPHWWGHSWDWSIYSGINYRSFCGIYSK